MLNDLNLLDIYDTIYQEIYLRFTQRRYKYLPISNFVHHPISEKYYIQVLQETNPKIPLTFLNLKHIFPNGEVTPLTMNITLIPLNGQLFHNPYSTATSLTQRDKYIVGNLIMTFA